MPIEPVKVAVKPIVRHVAVRTFTPPTGQVLGLIERASFETGISTTTLAKIVFCESGYNQSAVNTKNFNGSSDFGLFQINSIHLSEAERLGLDIKNSAEDNTTYAIILLKRYGTKPWVCKG